MTTAFDPTTAKPAASSGGFDPTSAKPVPTGGAGGGFDPTTAKPLTAAPATAPTPDPTIGLSHIKTKYAQTLDAAATKYGLDPALLRSIHFVEDASEDPNVVSSANAIGEMQMEPDTFKRFAQKGAKITDPSANIDAGAHYLGWLMHRYGGNLAKVATAYNAGEGAVDRGAQRGDYARNVQELYKRLTANVGGPGTNPLPHRAVAAKATPAPSGPELTLAEINPRGGTISAIPGGAIGGAAERAGQTIEHSLRDAVANIHDTFNLGANEQAALQKIGQLGPVQGAAKGAQIFSDLTLLPFSGLEAVMRDVATGNTKNIGDLGTRVMSALKDPLHAGDFLDQLTEKYGPWTRATNLWWAQQPGIRERLAAAKPKTPEGIIFQQSLGMRADAGRFLLNKSYLSGSLGFLTGMIAPVGPEMALMRGATKGATKVAELALKPLAAAAVRVAPKAAVKVAARTADLGAYVDAAKEKVLSTAPIVGDRYRPVWKAQGEQGENRQRFYARNQGEAHYSAHQVLGQEIRLGGTTPEQRLAVHQEADKFFNPFTTLHVDQPEGGDPFYDELTGTTTMKKGPAWGQKVIDRSVVYADHPAPNLPRSPNNSPYIPRNQEAATIFAGQQPDIIANFNRRAGAGDVQGALSMVPGMQAADAARFAQAAKAKAAEILKEKPKNDTIDNILQSNEPQSKTVAVAARKILRDLTMKKALGHWATVTGRDAVERQTPHGVEVLIPHPIKAMERDDTTIGNVSVHDRAVYTTQFMHGLDDATTTLAPSMKNKMLQGFFPRGGMFSNEVTPLEKLEGPQTSLAGTGGGGAGALGAGPKREYGSIRDALADGQQINPTFDPADAAERSTVQSLRFQNYMRYVLDESKRVKASGVTNGRINYDTALDRALKTGRLTKPHALPPEDEPLGYGPTGRVAYEKWVADEATARMKDTISPTQLADTKSDQFMEVWKAQQSKIHQAIEEQWNADHPTLTWQSDKELGVDDLAGLTVPKVNVGAAIDGHPVLAQQAGRAPSGAWALRDAPESYIGNSFETLNNLFRTAFLADILYHPAKNLARLSFGFGYLNPIEIAQGLFAPHTIDDEILGEADKLGATANKFNVGPATPKTHALYSYATPDDYAKTPKGVTSERGVPGDVVTPAGRSRLGRRIQTALDGYRNVAEGAAQQGAGPLGVGMHVLGKAAYNADKWNTEWTFQVWEDALSALTYRKLRDRGIAGGLAQDEAKARAANETRRILGDSGNITATERQLGAQRLNWFYGWSKGQWRLWSRIMSNPRAAQFFVAQSYGVRTANENTTVPNPQDFPEDLIWGYDGDKPLAIGVGRGYMKKAEGIADLATAPLTAGAGLMDFADAAASDFYNTLNPVMRMIFENAAQTFGFAKGQAPSPWGALFDRDLPLGDAAKQAVGQVGAQVMPSSAAAIQKAAKEKDPRYLMDLLGIPVKNLNETQNAWIPGYIAGKYRKTLEDALRAAPTNAMKDRLKEIYGPLIEKEEQQQSSLRGY